MSITDDEDFVPPGFEVPAGLAHSDFELAPLGPQHNESDYRAWTSSIEHIRSTPGFEGSKWPYEMPIEENLGDLRQHAEDFLQRKGFTYTVLAGSEVIGCVYIYPAKGVPGRASVRSWVRSDRADLDRVLYVAVREWLSGWPFQEVDYAPRPLADS